MKCNICDGEWDSPSGKSLTVCPFCNSKVLPMTDLKDKKAKDVLKEIVCQFGESILLESSKLTGLISDLLESNLKMKKMLKLATNENIPQKILKLKPCDENEKAIGLKKIVFNFSQENSLIEHVAQDTVFCFVYALGWIVCEAEDDNDKAKANNKHENIVIKPVSQLRIENSDISQPTPGDIVYFGTYLRSELSSNKNEKIAWRVLEVENGKALLLADKILDAQHYNVSKKNITWETCTLHKWLNEDFYNAAFTDVGKAQILTTDVVNGDNPKFGTPGGKNTKDKIFLLSYAEATNPLYGFKGNDTTDPAREAQGTKYAINQGLLVLRDENGYWWLRSPGGNPYSASVVYTDGSVYYVSVDITGIGIRPALWLNL